MDVETLLLKLERINLLTDILLDLLLGNPKAMALAESILDLSTMPEA